MRKKLLAIILSVIMCSSLFAGCALIEHNSAKDARQVVAVVDSVEDTTNGVAYSSGKRYIYKLDLANACNSYAASYMQNYGLTAKQAVERILDELVTRELLLIEAERMLKQGLIDWTDKEENLKRRNIYAAIDSRLTSLKGDILSDFDESSSDSPDDSVSSNTTYPVPDAETTDDDYTDYETDERGNIKYQDKKDESGNTVLEQAKEADGAPMYNADGTPVMIPVRVPVYKKWEPSVADYPGMWGDDDRKSLEKEAVSRFVALIKDLVKDDFKVTKEDKAKFKEDDARIQDVINTKGIEYVYPMLGDTHYMEYLVGVSAKQSILLSLLQQHIVEGVTVTDDEVVDAYQKQLSYQVETYRDNQSAYQSDLSGGNTTMLYMRDDSYFYVKHILLPFSDAQTAYLTAYKNDPKNVGKDYTEMRDTQMVNETKVYPHVNGEDDKTNPKTVAAVFDEIYSAMLATTTAKEAERLFDEFTYKYNTDPGAFGTGKSYAVKKNDDEGHSGFMEEFYDGAMKLYDNYKVGDVLPELVVTDYGVHIMYFAQDVNVIGYKRQLGDYLTPGEYATVRDSFRDTIKSTKENNAFTAWQNERITYYQNEENNKVHKYAKRYKSLYEA